MSSSPNGEQFGEKLGNKSGNNWGTIRGTIGEQLREQLRESDWNAYELTEGNDCAYGQTVTRGVFWRCSNFFAPLKAPNCQPTGPLGSVVLGQNMDISGRLDGTGCSV